MLAWSLRRAKGQSRSGRKVQAIEQARRADCKPTLTGCFAAAACGGGLGPARMLELSMTRGDVSKYRLRALECRSKAATAFDPKDKAMWHELERVWLDLAVRVDAEERPRGHRASLKPH